MGERRVYRVFKNPEFPLSATLTHKKRVSPVFINIHYHSCMEFLYIARGNYEVFHSGEIYTVQTGDICIFLPGQRHCIRNTDNDTEHWAVCFSLDSIAMTDGHFFQKEFVQPLVSGRLDIPTHLCADQISDRMRSAITVLANSRDRYERFRAQISLCLDLIPFCGQQAVPETVPVGHPAVNQCIDYLHANIANKITLDDLARYVHLNPNYLSSLFKKEAGQTVFEYLNCTRILKSRSLLEKTSLSIAQIAEQVGFNSTDFFTRKFREQMGMTPSVYRQSGNFK